MTVARCAAPLVIGVALAFTASSHSVIGLFDTFSKLFAGVGLVYVLRWSWWRINVWSEMAGLVTSAALTLGLKFWHAEAAALLPSGLASAGQPTFAGSLLVVFLGSLLVVIPVTLLTPPVDREHLAAFFARVRPMGAWGPVEKPTDFVAPGSAVVVAGCSSPGLRPWFPCWASCSCRAACCSPAASTRWPGAPAPSAARCCCGGRCRDGGASPGPSALIFPPLLPTLRASRNAGPAGSPLRSRAAFLL